MLSRVTLIAVTSLLLTQAADAKLAAEYQAPEVRLAGDTVTLPIVMVREFPFIEGSVNGVHGKFMLDTGAQRAMALNDHRIPLTGGFPMGTGHFGSGQTFDVTLRPKATDVNVAGLHFDSVTRVQSQDATMLERITPDFLGWFGYQAWSAYAMKLNYQTQEATFYRAGPDAFLAGEKRVARVPYTIRKLPNIPLVKGALGSMDLIVSFDTGQQGNIYVDAATRDRWVKEGRLVPDGEDTYDVKGLRLGDGFTVDVPKLRLWTTPFPAAEPTGITEPFSISLGYALLSQYVTVWDFPSQSLYFLKAHGRLTAGHAANSKR